MAGVDPVSGVSGSDSPESQVIQADSQTQIDKFNTHLAQAVAPAQQDGAAGPPRLQPNQELSRTQLDDLRGRVNFKFNHDESPQRQEALKGEYDKAMSYLSHSEGWDKVKDRLYNPGDKEKLTVSFKNETDHKVINGTDVPDQTQTSRSSNTVQWNPRQAVQNNGYLSPAASLGHEIGGHAGFSEQQRNEMASRTQLAGSRNLTSPGVAPAATEQDRQDMALTRNYGSVEEGKVIKDFEQGQLVPGLNDYRQAQGMTGRELTRSNYDGKPVPVTDVLCADQSCVEK